MEQLRRTPEAYARTLELLEKGMGEGAHKIVPSGLDIYEWNKIANTALMYFKRKNTSLRSIANDLNISHQTVKKRRDLFIDCFYENCSDDIKKNIPKETLLINKPNSLTLNATRHLDTNGVSSRIIRQVKDGVTDRKEIAENLGIKLGRITIYKDTLENRGIYLTKMRKRYEDIEKKLAEDVISDDELQKILDSLPWGSITSFIERNENQKIFMYLGKFLKSLGFSARDAELVGNKLESAKIPVHGYESTTRKADGEGFRNYWVIYAKDDQILRVKNEINKMHLAGELKKVVRK